MSHERPQQLAASGIGGGSSSCATYGVGTSVAAPASRREPRVPQPAIRREPSPSSSRLEIVIDQATASPTDRRTKKNGQTSTGEDGGAAVVTSAAKEQDAGEQ
jgi:hypothetical protein